MKDKTILIMGASSFVGSNLAEFLKKDYKMYGTYFKNKVEIPGVTSFHCDIRKKEEIQTAIFLTQPDFILYCIGLSDLINCHHNTQKAEALNANSLYHVTDVSQRLKSKMIYFSSSLVFSGDKESYGEIDIPDYATHLGRTKASGEYFLETSSPNYIIFRCCQLYGRNIALNRPTFFEQLQRNKEIFCDSDISMGFLDVSYLGMIVSLTLESNLRNILVQVSSQDIETRYNFAKRYLKVFGGNPNLIKKSKINIPFIPGITHLEKQKLTFKLKTKNIENYLNISLPTIEESLDFSKKRFSGRNFL